MIDEMSKRMAAFEPAIIHTVNHFGISEHDSSGFDREDCIAILREKIWELIKEQKHLRARYVYKVLGHRMIDLLRQRDRRRKLHDALGVIDPEQKPLMGSVGAYRIDLDWRIDIQKALDRLDADEVKAVERLMTVGYSGTYSRGDSRASFTRHLQSARKRIAAALAA